MLKFFLKVLIKLLYIGFLPLCVVWNVYQIYQGHPANWLGFGLCVASLLIYWSNPEVRAWPNF